MYFVYTSQTTQINIVIFLAYSKKERNMETFLPSEADF